MLVGIAVIYYIHILIQFTITIINILAIYKTIFYNEIRMDISIFHIISINQ